MRILLTIAFVLLQCATPTPNPVTPDPPVTPATCESFCDHGKELGCEWVKPTPEGTSCVAVCESVQVSGIVKWDLECRVKARSCDEVDDCER